MSGCPHRWELEDEDGDRRRWRCGACGESDVTVDGRDPDGCHVGT